MPDSLLTRASQATAQRDEEEQEGGCPLVQKEPSGWAWQGWRGDSLKSWVVLTSLPTVDYEDEAQPPALSNHNRRHSPHVYFMISKQTHPSANLRTCLRGRGNSLEEVSPQDRA